MCAERGSPEPPPSARTASGRVPHAVVVLLVAAAVPLVAMVAWSCVSETARGLLEAREGADGPRRLVYWEKWTGFEGEAMQHVVDRFNARQLARAEAEAGYRPIAVEKVIVSQVDRKFLVAVAGGDPPDLGGLWSNNVASFADKGALVDLTDRLAGAGITRERYLGVYWDRGKHRGRMWAVPTTPATTALHCNTRLFREVDPAWEDPPRTIEEFDEWAEKLTKWRVTTPEGESEIRRGYCPDVPDDRKRLIQVGFLPSEPGWWPWQWGYHFGGTLYDQKRGVTTDAPANVRAYEWIASYSRKLGPGNIQRFQSGFGNFSSPQNAFLSGKVGMQVQGVWMYNFLRKYAPGMKWRAGAFPHPADRPDLKNATYCDADVLVIPRDCPHLDEAMAFVRFVCSQEGMEILCLGQRKFSPLAEESEQFRRAHPHPYIGLFRSLARSPNAYTTPQVGMWQEYSREMQNAYTTIQNHPDRPVADILKAVRQDMQKAADRERRRYERRYGAVR